MINHGASTARFLNSAESAWEIVDLVHKQHSLSTEVFLQGFVDLKRAPNETRAGTDIKAEDMNSKLLGTDIIIAYGHSHIHHCHDVADNCYRFMGPIWKEQCARFSYIVF